jgi:hypothetical protein
MDEWQANYSLKFEGKKSTIMFMETNTNETIKNLELELLQETTRKSLVRLDQLLDENFLEFASNGEIYSKNDILSRLPNQNYKFEMSDFKLIILSDVHVLATYKIKRIDLITNESIYSLRSSIWNLKDNEWKMFFHQGTVTKEI